MAVHFNPGAANAAGVALRGVLGNDQVRVRIGGELAALRAAIATAPADDLFVQSVALWRENFARALRHPDPQTVIDAFVPELVGLLRDFPQSERVEPLVRAIMLRMRDPNSLFYSPQYAREAAQPPVPEQPNGALDPARLLGQLRQIEANRDHQVQREDQAARGAQLQGRIDLPGPAVAIPAVLLDQPRQIEANRNRHVQWEDQAARGAQLQERIDRPGPAAANPAVLLDQLRQIEANRNRQVQRDAQAVDGLRDDLLGRVQQREAQLQGRIDQVARRYLDAVQPIGQGIAELRQQDQELREAMREAGHRMHQRAEELMAGADRLQAHLDENQHRLNELERANMQLQVDIDRTRSQIEDKKSNWLLDAACIVGSVVLSLILEMPIVILPPK